MTPTTQRASARATTSRRKVALLRGINVGTAKRVAMADLRALLEHLGYGDVKTLLNSGNVVFDAPGSETAKIARRIQRGIEVELGVRSRVTVLTLEEVDRLVEQNPLLDRASEPTRLMVAVLNDPADRARLAPLLTQDWGADALALGERAAYLWCPDGALASKLAAAIEKTLKDGVTSRNWATTLKLHALMHG